MTGQCFKVIKLPFIMKSYSLGTKQYQIRIMHITLAAPQEV